MVTHIGDGCRAAGFLPIAMPPSLRHSVDSGRLRSTPIYRLLPQAANEQFESNIPNDLTKLLKETCKYIEDVVSTSLRPTPEPMHQPGVIKAACNSFKVTGIATLCHDTHVETFLSKEVALSDGFSETSSGCTKDDLAVDPPGWNPDDLTSDLKTPFLKLHGSVNWFRYDDGTIRRIPAGCNSERIKIGSDFRYSDPGGRPLLLIGTFNKMSDYSLGIFRDLHWRLRSTMRNASRLVICGYSFGDKGINEELVDWVHEKKGRRFVIIDPACEDSLYANARGVIQKHWNKWKNNGSIEFIHKRFECVDITELEEAISPP